VAPPYESSVAAIYVEPGERVRKGAPLVQLESAPLSRALAELAVRQAELISRMAQVKSKLHMTRNMLPFATEQNDQLHATLRQVEDARQRGFSNGRRIEESLTVSFSAHEKLIELQAQETGLTLELTMTEKAQKEAEAALAHLKRIYGDGRILAPVDGIVGPDVAAQGDVLVSGAKVLRLYANEPYVLAYLPDNYLFGLSPGQEVLITTGTHQSVGSVETVLPVADSLPPEFQNTFRPRDRSQLVRIRLTDSSGFATHQKVRVSQCYLNKCRPLTTAFMDELLSIAGLWQRPDQPAELRHSKVELATSQTHTP
jgi:multidrug resistance efflux pump